MFSTFSVTLLLKHPQFQHLKKNTTWPSYRSPFYLFCLTFNLLAVCQIFLLHYFSICFKNNFVGFFFPKWSEANARIQMVHFTLSVDLIMLLLPCICGLKLFVILCTLTEMQTERLALVAMYHINISEDRLPFLLPVLLLHHPQLQHILLFCQTFALFVQSNFLFLEDKWDKSSEWNYLISCMFLISAISNHNISYVSAKSGHYTLKTALFAWKTTHYLFKLSSE